MLNFPRYVDVWRPAFSWFLLARSDGKDVSTSENPLFKPSKRTKRSTLQPFFIALDNNATSLVRWTLLRIYNFWKHAPD